jgi:hypothetical protein
MIKYADRHDKFMSYIRSEYGNFKLSKIKTNLTTKPIKAFWGTRAFTNYSWIEAIEDLCLNVDYEDVVYWRLKNKSKILQVTLDDIKNGTLDEFIIESQYEKMLDYKKMKGQGIVALELMDGSIGHYFTNSTEILFNAFDCESIVVLDPKMICVDFILDSKNKYFNELKMTKDKYDLFRLSAHSGIRMLTSHPALLDDFKKLDTWELEYKYQVSRTTVAYWRKTCAVRLGMSDDQLYPKIRKYQDHNIIPVDELFKYKASELSKKYGCTKRTIWQRKSKVRKRINEIKKLSDA